MFVTLKKDFLGQAAGKVIDVADADGQALITSGVADACAGDPLAPIIQKSMEALTTNVTKSLNSVVEITLKRFQEVQEQARKNSIPAIFGLGNTGDPKHNFADWLQHAVAACTSKGKGAFQAAEYLDKSYGQGEINARQKAALGESSGVTGGYIVPPQFAEKIMGLMAEDTFIRPRAFVQPMTSASLQIPYLDITTAQAAGVSAFFGGMQAAWTAEAQTRQEYEPQFKQLELRPWELSAYSVSSNVLLQDAIGGFEKFLMVLFAKVIGWTEEYAFLQGNGVGKPLGMLNTSGPVIQVTRATSGKISYADVANLMSRLLPSSLSRAVWVVHPYGLIDLVQLRDAAGRVVWVDAMGGAQQSVPGYLFGRPVFISEKVPTYGTAGDLSLLDPGLYVIGDRMALEVAASEHVNFLKNQMTWRIVERVDGRPWIEKAITLADGSSTVSPFVTIAT
jgi:HK97 family phage major capsid protein